jgi:hypothetical protein
MDELFLTQKKYQALITRLDEIVADVTTIKLQSHPEEHYIDNNDLLMILHVTNRTIIRWRNSGLLPFKKLGNKFYYRADLVLDSFKMLCKAPVEAEKPIVGVEKPTVEVPPQSNDEIPITCERCPLFMILNSED